jgi:hypothetical protein
MSLINYLLFGYSASYTIQGSYKIARPVWYSAHYMFICFECLSRYLVQLKIVILNHTSMKWLIKGLDAMKS